MSSYTRPGLSRRLRNTSNLAKMNLRIYAAPAVPAPISNDIERRYKRSGSSFLIDQAMTRLATLLSSAGRAQDCNCNTTIIRYLEARGSIPRGETILLHVPVSFCDRYWCCNEINKV